MTSVLQVSIMLVQIAMQKINAEKTAKELITFIQSVCNKEHIEDILIAVSGGIDSATSLTLAVQALGADHVHPILLPYGSLNDQGSKDARLVIESVKIPSKNIQTVNIKPFVDSIATYDATMDEPRLGNIMARMRMIILYDLSKKYNYLVVGTENKTEHLLGYYTRFGDEASDIEPLRNLYKSHVYELATYLQVPHKVLTKAPSAGLWEGQTDEGEFGFSYKIVDEVLYLLTEEKLSKKEIIKKGYDAKTIERIWWWIEKGEFKDRVAYTPK